jgi:hypothetical protein
MNVFWGLFLPFFISATAIAVYLAMRLHFFSSTVRELLDVLPEVEELDVDNLQRLLSGPADEYLVSRYGGLNFRQRQEASYKRFNVTRRGLQTIISNAVLFEQVARFYIRQIQTIDPKQLTEEEELVFQTFDRAAICHLLASFAYAKLQALELCHIAWPWYLPAFGGLCDTRGHDLFASYKSLVSSVLELARHDDREWIYDNLLFALTGLIECGENGLAGDR